MAVANNNPEKTPSMPGMPSAELRSVLSLLLILHLFALVVALSSNFGPISGVRQRLRGVPFVTNYLQALNMDTAYNFHLTYGDQLDVDHTVLVEIPAADGGQPTTIDLADEGSWFGICNRRYRMLAFHIAETVEDDSRGAILPRAIGARMITETGAANVKVRCRAHMLQSREDVESVEPTRTNPNSDRFYRTVYEALVWNDPAGTQVLKSESGRDTAPAAAPITGPAVPAPIGLPIGTPPVTPQSAANPNNTTSPR